jgi:NNP family nitrate/nitrite transporter-like MFS transporter
MYDEAIVRRTNLIYATLSFALAFAAWGLISAFATAFRADLHLTGQSTALLVAVPVLLGALARLPVGLLTDRFGGRIVFTVLLLVVAVPAWITPSAVTYGQLVTCAFFLGLAGASFAAGVGFCSRWFGAERQGTALGVYGLGNVGHSAAVFLGPVIAARTSRESVFHAVAILCVIWAVAFFLLARDAPGPRKPASPRAMVHVLTTQRLSWLLGAFYFLTFGGFVALRSTSSPSADSSPSRCISRPCCAISSG